MRLRTFESFWLLKNGILNSYPSLQGKDESSQIVVIGAGITGALISHALMEKNYEVLLIDKRDIAMGSTAATTCMLQYEIDVPLYQMAELIGEQAAAKCYQAGVDAIRKLQQLVEKNNLDCGFQSKKSLYIARTKKDALWLKKEFEIRNKHLLAVTWLEAEEVLKDYGIACYGAILSEVAASADAYQMAHQLIALNAKRGMKVYDQTRIEKFDFKTNGATLFVEDGSKINCEKVIFCSGYEASELLREKTADLFYTYACVSEKDMVLPEKLNHTLVWDTGNPYLYIRSTDDGRLLIGGEDAKTNHSFFQQRIKERKSEKLQHQLKIIMPDIHFVEDFSWGGTFGSTKDGLPYIGKSPEYDNALFVLGYGGNGIVFSIQGMDIVCDLLEGNENELSTYYRFGR